VQSNTPNVGGGNGNTGGGGNAGDAGNTGGIDRQDADALLKGTDFVTNGASLDGNVFRDFNAIPGIGAVIEATEEEFDRRVDEFFGPRDNQTPPAQVNSNESEVTNRANLRTILGNLIEERTELRRNGNGDSERAKTIQKEINSILGVLDPDNPNNASADEKPSEPETTREDDEARGRACDKCKKELAELEAEHAVLIAELFAAN